MTRQIALRGLLLLALIIVLAGALAYVLGDLIDAELASHPSGPVLPACEYEDSRDCIWDADEVGNGEGVSFVDIDGVAYYEETDR